jgi:hypothetical protein
MTIGQRLPIVEIIQLHRVTLRPDKYSHVVLPVFVASAPGDAGLGEIHDLKGVRLVFDAVFGTEIEPLLVASRVRVDLHEEIVSVFF